MAGPHLPGSTTPKLLGISNISDCFLCAALGWPPLAAVPLAFPLNSSTTTENSFQPLTGIPLFDKPLRQNFSVCYASSSGSPCNRTIQVTSQIYAPPGSFFWYNGTLTKTLNSSTASSPRTPITLVP